jgi:tetratricopeptide (TPR) repeat protein
MFDPRKFSFVVLPVCVGAATLSQAAEAPEKALKYHEVLLKRPHNAALFDRFFGAWIDEQPVEALGAFLKERAEKNGGLDWSVLATYELRRGNEDLALAALAKAIEAVPEDVALPMERGKLRLRRLEFKEAREDLAKVAAGKDEVLALEASKLIGKSWLREGRTEEAIKAWDAVLAAHPGDEDLLEDLVETAAAESETAQALVYAAKLIEASKDPYQKTLRMLRRGDLLAQAGKSDEAVSAYVATLDQVGDGSWLEREVLAQIEKAYRKQDRLDDLSAQLKKLAEANPRRLLIHRQLAKLEAAQGETDAAIGRFREVLKRSPGERELREEFVRLLSDGERYDDAAAELDKLIEQAPTESGLHLQVAALRFRQGKPEAVLAALKKAHDLLGKDEGNGIRIASLMLQYNLTEPGEALLKELAAAAGAGPVALETLAAHYGRTNRKTEAIDLLKKAGSGDDVETLLRTTGSISALGESGIAYETLTARAEKYSAEPRFLAALTQSALAAGKAPEALPHAIKLVRLAKQTSELAESIGLASRVITAAEKADEVRTTLAGQASRTPAETCLLASLIEDDGDFVEVAKLLDPNPDPMVVHFHAALLDRRGEFDTAIAVLSRLADTDEGRKAAYFKDLSELQQRAGKTVEALATVERWKQSAPGDKTAWITGSRLLRDSGKPEEAVKMTRQAVSRFEGDSDLAASLASLHDEAGQWADSEAIYWRLYDEAQSPGDQARWAVQLAQLAQRTAKITELEEKLRERARGNRRSIGPVLAQAELARVTNNEDKRRDLLLEAVRLQPKDVDLRIQIANLEEQAGNPDRVLAVLEEALPYDVNGRVRSSLAQAYLRQGQAVKGMREMRLLAGKAGFDPRSAESAASSLAATKLYDEAISLLRSELPNGGDWRSRYLLAVLLEEDGREAEALPIFLSLLQAQGEIPTLLPPAPRGSNQPDPTSKEVAAIQALIASSQAAYAHRNGNQGYGRMRFSGMAVSQTGPFNLPDHVEEVRQLSLIHLCSLSKKKSGEVDESIRAQIKASGIENAAFVTDLIAATQDEERQDLMKLLETHPDQTGLYEVLMSYGGMYGGNGGLNEKITRRVLEHPEKLSPVARFSAWASLTTTGRQEDQDPFDSGRPAPKTAKPEDPAWTSMLEAAKAGIEEKNGQTSRMIAWQLMTQLQAEAKDGGFPEIHRAAAKKLLLDAQARYDKEHPEDAHNGYSLTVLAVAGPPEAWLEELNATIREMRKKPAMSQGGGRSRFGQILRYASMSGMYSMRMSGYNPWNSYGDLFTLPTLETLPTRSIPDEVLSVFNVNADNPRSSKPPIKIEDLLKTPEKIESTYLRAWLAAKAGNKEAVAKALAATPVNEELCDFELLRAAMLIEEKKFPEAFAALQKARSASGSDRELSGSINVSLIAVAGAMSPQQRSAVAADLQATFLQSRQMFGQQGASVLAMQAGKLGLEELAKRIDPVGPASQQKAMGSATGPAAIAAALGGSSSSSSSGSPEKISKFVGEKKYEAAAREVLQNIRAQGAQSSPYYFTNELPELLSMLGKDGQAELLKQIDPGDSKSLVKRLEYVDVVQAMGKPELSLPVLEGLVKERPEDASISARLVFALPSDQMDRRVELMTKACKSDAFVFQAHQIAEKLDNEADTKAAMSFFEAITRWLEGSDEKALSGVNLTWVSYHSKEFFDGDYTTNLPSLLSTTEEPKEDKAAFEKFRSLSERLARAMIRHSSCAEEGFRLLCATKTLKIEPAEMDNLARKAVLSTATPAQEKDANLSSRVEFFMLRLPNGSGSSGENYAGSSSATWLIKRLKDVKSPAEILTPEFVTALKTRNLAAGELLESLSRDLKNEDLAVLWKSDVMKSSDTRFSEMLRPVLIKRLASAPGATKFFVDQISRIEPGTAISRNGGSQDREKVLPMFSAAMGSALSGKPEEIDAVAKAISRAVFGEKLDFTDPKTHQHNYQRVNFMEELFQEYSEDAVQLARYHSAFFKLGVPVDDDEYNSTAPFRNKSFQKVEPFEAFLESIGWLSEFDRWEPYACMLYNASSGPNGGVQITIKPTLLTERVLQYIDVDFSRDDAVKKLKERKKGRFGSLMTAAALSSGKQRSELAGLAFTEVSASLAKLPPERIESLALVLPWLPDDVRAKLPESFRRKVQAADAKRRQDAITAADEFIASLKSPNSRYAMNNLTTVVTALIPYDLAKAVEVFAAAEQEYTSSLGRGGQFSNSTSSDYQISQRDYALSQIMSRSDSNGPFAEDPKLGLKFLSRILATPSGTRLHFSSYYSGRSMFEDACGGLLKVKGQARSAENQIQQIVETYRSLEPELKPLGLVCLMLAPKNYTSDSLDEAVIKKIEAAAEGDPQAQRLAKYRILLTYAGGMKSPEQVGEARKLLAGILADGSMPKEAKLMIVDQALKVPLKDGIVDETTLSALVKLYQDYCAEERSAVAPISGSLLASLVKAPLRTETAAPLYAALAAAFWENTSVAKPSGHAAIPASLAQSAFIATLMGKDSASVAKVFPRIRTGLAGKLVPMLSLLQLGQTDLAKQLAPAPAAPFLIESHQLRYTKALEDSIADLRKAGLDPLTMLKLEIEVLAFQVGKDAEAPVEALDARVARLIDAFIASPPPGTIFPLAMHALLNRSGGSAKLRPLAVKWLKDNPIGALLIRNDRSSSSDQNDRVRQATLNMHGSFAMRALGEGDPSLLESISKAFEQPTGRNSYGVYESMNVLLQAMFRSIWRDVCIDNTAGYKAGMPVWNGLVLQYANQIANYDASEVVSALYVSQFLASLTNEEAAFSQMLEKMPEKVAPYTKKFSRDGGLFSFIDALNRRNSLENLTAAQSKKIFLEKILSKPGFAVHLKKNVGWVNRLTQNYGCKDALDVISVNPPASLIPEALPALYEYGGRIAYAKDAEKGMALTRKGVEACPEGQEWNGSRGMLKWQLADQLLAAKKPEDAKAIFVTIKPEEVAGWLKDRYNKTAKALGIEPPKPPQAPKTPAPAPAPPKP